MVLIQTLIESYLNSKDTVVKKDRSDPACDSKQPHWTPPEERVINLSEFIRSTICPHPYQIWFPSLGRNGVPEKRFKPVDR